MWPYGDPATKESQAVWSENRMKSVCMEKRRVARHVHYDTGVTV